MGGPGEGQGYPRADNDSQEAGRLGISMQAAPLPDLLAVFAIPSLRRLIKAPTEAIQLRYLSPGSCHSPQGQGSRGKHRQPTARSRGCKRNIWEQQGKTFPKTKGRGREGHRSISRCEGGGPTLILGLDPRFFGRSPFLGLDPHFWGRSPFLGKIPPLQGPQEPREPWMGLEEGGSQGWSLPSV